MNKPRAAIAAGSLLLALCVGAGYLFAQQGARSNNASAEAQRHEDNSAPGAEHIAADRLSRFAAVDIIVDAKDQPLAAYQVTFTAGKGDVRIVSIEGGAHPAFAEPPYYDPKAIQNQRAILAGFSTNDAKDLPKGRTRVATVHVEVRGDAEPRYDLKVNVAATVGGEAIPVQLTAQTQRGSI